MEIQFTILEKEQIFGNIKLEVFEKRGTKAAISDYAICCGGYVSNNNYTGDKQILENRTGWYWTKTDDRNNNALMVYSKGLDSILNVSNRDGGVRPALPFSSISNICPNRVRPGDGILEVEYGEYPQQAASKQLQKELERLFQRKGLSKTGKYYTRDSVKYDQYYDKFQKGTQEEYEYNGKKYVRVKVNSCYDGSKFKLSNGEKYQDGDYVWIEVEPIKWLVDERKNIAVSEKLLFAGIQFKHTRDYKGGKDFKNTDLKWFLDTYFSKEILSIDMKKRNSVYQQSVDEIEQELIELINLMSDDLKSKIQDRYNSIIDEYYQNRKKEEQNIFNEQPFFEIQDSSTTLLTKLLFLRGEIIANNEAILKLQKISEYKNLLNSTSHEKVEGEIEELIQNIKMEIQNTYLIYKQPIKERVESILYRAEKGYQTLIESSFENDKDIFHRVEYNPMSQLREELSQLFAVLKNPSLQELVEIQNAFHQESTDVNINSLSDHIKTMNYVVKMISNESKKEKWDSLKQSYQESFSSLFLNFLEEQQEENIKTSFQELRKDLLNYVDWVMVSSDVDHYRLQKREELENAEKFYSSYVIKDEIKPTISSLLTEEIINLESNINNCGKFYSLDTAYHIEIGKTLDQLTFAPDKETIDQVMDQFYKELTDIWAKVYSVLLYQKSEILVKKM